MGRSDVHLKADPVDGNVLAFERANHGINCIRLFVDLLGFGFVVKEQRVGIGLASPAEALREVVRVLIRIADPGLIVPERAAQSTCSFAFVEGLIDDIPSEDFSAVVGDDGLDVDLEEVGELLGGVVSIRQPGWILVVPYECVAAHFHVVTEGEVDDLIGLGEIEGLGVGTQNLPFQRVFGLDHIELASERGSVKGFGEVGGADRRPDQDCGTLRDFTERLGASPRETESGQEAEQQTCIEV